MPDEIINRVSNSVLKVFDLEDYYVPGPRIVIDLKDWLEHELILREKDFRERVKTHNWEQYKSCYVAIYCSTDAIVPDWAYMLIAIALQPHSAYTASGDLVALETTLYQNQLQDLDLTEFKDKPVIIKGCAKKPVPNSAYIMATNLLKPIAKSIMFGEACSAVPLYKRK
ncbi:DUF2480 family protein [Aurantibacter aestuarii]|uniref:DUF2480 domain-containing protein n=1 Tax=Aurantibacter aestuarii TaxID=1266046 RepID=A0A2T1NCJ0_9FLAO|nr:DUF2480 family protein [Aurantibacter aestuarii]PSG90127.1 hypothetical protein C7H52_02300 [Aurantibacter aestuarii]